MEILGAATKADPTCEAISTEDMISKMDDLNRRIQNGEVKPRRLMTGSLDVSALYPSINTKIAGRIVRDRVAKSKMQVEGVEYKLSGP